MRYRSLIHRSHGLQRILFIGSLLFCLSITPLLPLRPVQAASVAEKVQEGVTAYQAGQYFKAQDHWIEALRKVSTAQERLIILENLARLANQLGQFPQAASYWQQALTLSRSLDDRSTQSRLLIEQAQTYGYLGQHRRAISLLCGEWTSEVQVSVKNCQHNSAVALARALNEPTQTLAALGSLGEQYRLLGEYQPAEATFQIAKELLQQFDIPSYQIAVAQGLGSLYASLAKLAYRQAETAEKIGDLDIARSLREKASMEDERALTALEQGLTWSRQYQLGLSTTKEMEAVASKELQLLIHLIPIYARQGQVQISALSKARALKLLEQVPNSQAKIFAIIDLARLLQPLPAHLPSSQNQCLDTQRSSDAKQLLQRGVALAQRLKDPRAEAFAQGMLGHWAECQGNYRQALALTQSARLLARQDLLGTDSLYFWDWQLGRILKAQGRRQEAAVAYQSAIATLKEIRGDILTADPELRFDFRDTIEPIYRELAALELSEIPVSQILKQTGATGKTIRRTLQTLDSLKLAELQNYFGSDCAIVPTATVIDLNAQQEDTAVVNTLIFPERTAVIVSLPNGATQVEWIEQNQETLRETVNAFRRGLETYFRDFEPQLAKQLYGWLVQPFETQLHAAGIKTLVFVNDGILRSVPMAALHDGKGFLVERYAIATTPSLELTDPQSLNPERLRALALGLTDAVTVDDIRFAPLPFVNQEIDSVVEQLLGTETLLNQAFSRDRLRQALSQQRYSILHIATHGQFGAEPESNFIVTGTGEKLTIAELDRLIRQLAPGNGLGGEPIELLALTACETAIGDERATLGLAGVAIRAGARSAIASLWSINDAATSELVAQFYGGLLNPQLNKAEALQAAQVTLIRQGGEAAHPARWAPLILVGNWL